MSDLDMEHLKSWIGKVELASEPITAGLMQRFEATTGLSEVDGTVPLGLHWCLAPATFPMDELSSDGHPARGGFLPPVPLPNRMWAGGTLAIHGSLSVGDDVTRRSEIKDVVLKEGRSGKLCFVTVNHALIVGDEERITETQNIVYRDKTNLSRKPQPTPEPGPPATYSQKTRIMDEVLLFRYSAITFNGHRIHYDFPHVTEAEGYDGLVVHGPLQATLLMAFGAANAPKPLKTFSFRGVSPMIAGHAFTMEGREDGENGLSLKAVNTAGITTMEANAAW